MAVGVSRSAARHHERSGRFAFLAFSGLQCFDLAFQRGRIDGPASPSSFSRMHRDSPSRERPRSEHEPDDSGVDGGTDAAACVTVWVCTTTWVTVRVGPVTVTVRVGPETVTGKRLKTDASMASVPLSPSMASWLTELRPPGVEANAPVLPSEAGGPLNYANVYNRVLRPALRKAGIAVVVDRRTELKRGKEVEVEVWDYR